MTQNKIKETIKEVDTNFNLTPEELEEFKVIKHCVWDGHTYWWEETEDQPGMPGLTLLLRALRGETDSAHSCAAYEFMQEVEV